MLTYSRGKGKDKNWIIGSEGIDLNFFGKYETLMSQGNGYIGMRAVLEERYFGETRNSFVAGSYNKADKFEVTELPNIPDLSEIEIKVNGEKFSLNQGQVESTFRELNLRTGELKREVFWKNRNGDRVQFIFKRTISLDNLHLLAFNLEIIALNSDVKIGIKTGINGQTTNSGAQHFYEGEKRVYENRYMQYVVKTTESGVDFVISTTGNFSVENREEYQMKYSLERRALYMNGEFSLKRGEKGIFEKIATVYTSLDKEFENNRDLESIKKIGIDSLKDPLNIKYEKIEENSKIQWEKYWNNVGIEIETEEEIDILSLRFAQYHMRIMTPFHDERFSIAAKGLTGEGYKGHIFWDTEIFLLPYYQFTYPNIARQLLRYRYLNLQGARNKAEKFGYEGAMFPWESAYTGEEETPEWAAMNIVTGKATKVWSGIKEHHITADIAYAVKKYVDSTGDSDFMAKEGLKLIIESADFWCSRAVWNGEKKYYEILDVIGPDEYTEHVDNNAYTNYMAKENIDLAIQLCKEYSLHEKLERYVEVSGKIYLPHPNSDEIIPQDDTFLTKGCIDIKKYREDDNKQSILKDYSRDQIINLQVLKQADVTMLLYLLKEKFEKDTIKKNWEYYEGKTIHDSSLSMGVHSIVATYFGDIEKAYDCFKEACAIDLGENMVSSDKGIHAAALGAIWMSAIFGFAGVTIKGDKLEIIPNLPQKWKSMRFKIDWRGEKMVVDIRDGKVDLRPLKGVIFDLDGVITDTAEYHYLAWKNLADRNSLYFDREINELLKGVSRMDSLKIILEKNSKIMDEKEMEAMATEKNEIYLQSIKQVSSKDILPGIVEMLEFLKRKGIAIALGSASKNAKEVIDSLGIKEYFQILGDGNSVEKSKPAPDIFLFAAKELGIAPENCIVVEDSVAGIVATKKAGMKGIAIGKKEDFLDADYVYEKPKDIELEKIFG